MKEILAFAGSNSKASINRQLVDYTVTLLINCEVQILDLNDFPLPVFSVDLEKEQGYPKEARNFSKYIEKADGIIMSLAEHNGSYTATFKNLFDWLSRIEGKTWRGKPILLMAASPGGYGGKGVLGAATSRFPKHDGQIVSQFSLPNFDQNFVAGRLINEELVAGLKSAVEQFENVFKEE